MLCNIKAFFIIKNNKLFAVFISVSRLLTCTCPCGLQSLPGSYGCDVMQIRCSWNVNFTSFTVPPPRHHRHHHHHQANIVNRASSFQKKKEKYINKWSNNKNPAVRSLAGSQCNTKRIKIVAKVTCRDMGFTRQEAMFVLESDSRVTTHLRWWNKRCGY